MWCKVMWFRLVSCGASCRLISCQVQWCGGSTRQETKTDRAKSASDKTTTPCQISIRQDDHTVGDATHITPSIGGIRVGCGDGGDGDGDGDNDNVDDTYDDDGTYIYQYPITPHEMRQDKDSMPHRIRHENTTPAPRMASNRTRTHRTPHHTALHHRYAA